MERFERSVDDARTCCIWGSLANPAAVGHRISDPAIVIPPQPCCCITSAIRLDPRAASVSLSRYAMRASSRNGKLESAAAAVVLGGSADADADADGTGNVGSGGEASTEDAKDASPLSK